MRRGCVAIGDVHCNGCGRIVRHPERYLAIQEKDGVEVEEGETSRYCVDCCLKKGYAYYEQERDKQILTFFPKPDVRE